MATFSKQKITGNSLIDGLYSIDVNSSIYFPTLVHTVSSNAALSEEVWLYAVNNSMFSQKVVVVSTTVNDTTQETSTNRFKAVIDSRSGLQVLVPGFFVPGGTSVNFKVYAENYEAVNVFGYVNRIS